MDVNQAKRPVLLLGGAGSFGSRLAKALVTHPACALTIAGRSLERSKIFIRTQLNGQAEALVLDRTKDAAALMAERRPFLVIDASGPFTDEGPGRYAIVEAALSAGAHYLDIADTRGFVVGIASLDPLARTKDRVAIAGASTTTALSSAVCDVLAEGFSQIDTIEIGVSPGNRAPRGRAVVASILSYAGRPIRVWRVGRWTEAPGWGLLRREVLGAAKTRPVGHRWLSLCDTADLELFPRRYQVQDRVLFRGGLELSVLHLGLSALSLAVRLGLARSLEPLAGLLTWLAKGFLPFGTGRGGMIVEMTGTDKMGSAHRRRWTLIAEGGDGPTIPTLGALILARKLLEGQPVKQGARPCLGEVPLAEFEKEFQRLRIVTELLDLPPRQSIV